MDKCMSKSQKYHTGRWDMSSGQKEWDKGSEVRDKGGDMERGR